MNEKNLILPFVTKAPNQNENMSYPAELACVTCIAESQRKKPSFLRDASEKIVLVSKLFYPLWVLSAGNSCLIIDGLNMSKHGFSFEEPTKIGIFVEELKKNTINSQKFIETLQNQAKTNKEFSSKVNLSFAGLIDDGELLSFLAEYLKTGKVQNKTEKETALIPSEIDSNAATATSQTFVYCARTIEADAKGIKYVLSVLKQELESQTNAITGEIEQLEEKRDFEVAILKPIVTKNIKKISQKQDKVFTSLQRSFDRRIGALEKKREKYMHKLQLAEQRKDAAQRRVDATKKKKSTSKSSSGSFALQKYGREIDNVKKEIKTVLDELDKLKKEGEIDLKLKKVEFQKAIAEEENQLTRLETACKTKTDEKQRQIEEMNSQARSITSNLENIIDELKRSGSALRSQVEVSWKLDDPDDLILAHLPVYLVKYAKGEEERFSLFSPISISEDISVMGGLKKMLMLNSESKMKELARPSNKKLQETLKLNVLWKMQNESDFRIKINQICRASNLIDLNNFGQTLNEGLDELEKKGWITREEAASLCKHVMRE
jgi:hypothetical protein